MMREHGGAWLSFLLALVVGLVLLPHPVQAQGVVMVAGARVSAKSADKGPRLVLVNADDEYASYLTEAVDFLEAGQYDEAIRILQELMRMPNGGFVPTDSPGVYRGLRLQAAEALTKLDPEGLKRYRMMFDTRARELYNEALAGDVAKLRTVSQIYAQTTYGARAVERLGAMYFDQGRFAQAEGVWRGLLDSPRLEPSERAVVLARLAAASHFSGHPGDRDWLAELKDKHPGARGEMGGQTRDLAEFVESLRAIDPATILTRSAREVFAQGWPGLGGAPSGTALMDDSSVLLEPRWTMTGRGSDRIDPAQLRANMMALPEALSSSLLNPPQRSGSGNVGNNVRVEMDRGHVLVRANVSASGQSIPPFILPPAVEPVIVGDEVIFRTADAVVALDVVTGREIWRTGSSESADLKMERPLTIQDPWAGYGGTYYADMGRYRITVGSNKVYTVSGFRPYVSQFGLTNFNRSNMDRNQLADTSRLIAIQIDPVNPTSGDRQGKRVWELGMGKGDDDLTRAGKFLSVPTYKDGRLYVMMEYIDAYHLVCLDDANKGALVWKSMVAQVPTQTGSNPLSGMPNEVISRAAPPAVADGRVYVATNGGVVAAVEADSGLPLWAYQYTPRSVVQRSSTLMAPTPALNPLIVAGGRVLVLPADSAQLLCLSAETGQPLWPGVSRRELNELSYIDDRRVLLSGEAGMMMIDTTSGQELWPAGDASAGGLAVLGRPAVSSSAVLASGFDCVWRLSLSDYKLTRSELKSPYGVLGNLLCSRGKLIASNAAGVCAYVNYEEAFAQLTRRIEAQKSEGASVTELLFQRAQLSFSDGRFDACLADLSACAAADAPDDSAERARLAPWFYRAYVGAANRSATPADMRANLAKAAEYATSDQERAHLMIRLMKVHQKAGDLKPALAAAQQLSDTYSDEGLVDVRIGPDADDSIRTFESMPETLGRTLAQNFIGAIVSTPAGRAAYAEHDQAARAAMDQALTAGDATALEQVADRWPHSLHAEAALFRAAEAYARQLESLEGEPRREAMGRIVATLSRILHGGNEAGTQASLALALVWSRGGVRSLAELALSNLDTDQLKAIQAQPFAFADYTGTVGELVTAIQTRPSDGPRAMPAVAPVSHLPKTWETLFEIKDQNTFILTDQDFEPVRLMDQVLALKDQRLVLVDTQAKEASGAAKWSAVSTVSPRVLGGDELMIPAGRVVAGLSPEGNVLCVADRESVSGVDVGTQKILWQKKMSDLGVSSAQFISIGQGVLLVNDKAAGRLVCVSLGTGEVMWQSPMSSAFAQLAQPVAVRGGLVLAISGNGQALLGWDLASGKVVADIPARQSLTAKVTPRGMLVAVVDGLLNIRDPKDFSKGLWPAGRQYGELLGVTDDLVLVCTPNRPDMVDVLSIPRGGERLCTMTMGAIGGVVGRPVDVCITDDRAYFTCFRGPQTPIPRRGQLPAGVGLSVQAFSLKNGAKLWQADFDAEMRYQLMPLRVCGDAVIVSPTQAVPANRSGNYASFVLLSDSQKGKEITRLLPEMESETAGRRLWSPPVVTNERILMETADGLRVIGKR